MANPGINPPDKSTPVGQLRLSIGDTQYDPENGYANFSDDELEQLLTNAGGALLRATAIAYAQLAAIAAYRSISIKTNDLSYAVEKTSTELRELAKFYSTEADKADDAALDESFEIVRFPGHDGRDPGLPLVL